MPASATALYPDENATKNRSFFHAFSNTVSPVLNNKCHAQIDNTSSIPAMTEDRVLNPICGPVSDLIINTISPINTHFIQLGNDCITELFT